MKIQTIPANGKTIALVESEEVLVSDVQSAETFVVYKSYNLRVPYIL